MRAIILGALLIASSGCSLIGAAIDQASGGDEVRRLRQVGVPAEAEIVRIWDTGTTINDDPVIGMEVEVLPSGGDPFRAVVPKTWISVLDIPQFQPGRIIAVRYDPADPSRAAIDDPPFPVAGLESSTSIPGIQTRVSFSLQLCARSEDEGFEAVFLVTGPAGRRFEAGRISPAAPAAPADGEEVCVQFPADFSPAEADPGRYRYEIRVDGKTAGRGVLTLGG